MLTHKERTPARLNLAYTEKKNSCEWEPEQRVHWYDQGYSQSQRSYASKPLSEVQYALTVYQAKGQLEHGPYERGLAHGLEDMLRIRFGMEVPV